MRVDAPPERALLGHGVQNLRMIGEAADAIASGAWSGPLTNGEALDIARALVDERDPDTVVRDLPWAVAVERADGRVFASCSTMFLAGLFYRCAPGGDALALATDPAAAVRAPSGTGRRQLNPAFLRGFARARSATSETPYDQVHRLAPGQTLSWAPRESSPSITEWLGAEALPTPCLDDASGLIERYLRTFDTVVAELARRTPHLVATVSGGLDSTFMAAALARAVTPGRRAYGYCHTPLRHAHALPRGRFDPDDFPLAQLMASRYPAQLRIAPLRNDAEVHPLDAAAAMSARSGFPVLSPGNAVWLNAFAGVTNAHGATLRFHAGTGNASYSYDHRYAAGWYLRRGQLGKLASLHRGRERGTSTVRALRHRVAAPLRPRRRAAETTERGFLRGSEAGLREYEDRQWYLDWLIGRRGSFASAFNPAESYPALVADPFAARSMIELAAAIEPRVWQEGHGSRSFARRLAQGRVPDPIRLRERRGGQAMDTWYVVRRQPARMVRGLEILASSGIFAGELDADGVFAWWRAACDLGPHEAPDQAALKRLLRLVALAEFAESFSPTVPCPEPSASPDQAQGAA
ncbi:MAG: hypothetical protein E6Q90_13940 [Actinobacteria bacterium]|nr:MAG: hypothetical protein E6Q90_13940 [Actinomycetota bacterium]